MRRRYQQVVRRFIARDAAPARPPGGPAGTRQCDDDWVPTLNDLARRAQMAAPDIEWLHALVSDWQLLADLSFADLVLWTPLPAYSGWIALARRRAR